MKKIVNKTPYIETCDNFLTPDECREIIDFARPTLVPGKIAGANGRDYVDYAHRTAFTTYVKESDNFALADRIFDRVSKFTGFDKSRFEMLTVIKYEVGQEFKLHQDYFVELPGDNNKETQKRCSRGGNRSSTIILYLNDVDRGGETYFPWLDKSIKPACGRLARFDYNYDDFMDNVKSQHLGMPVLAGEKWIVTIWVREAPLTETITDYTKYDDDANIYQQIQSVEYELEVGPEDDRRTLKLTLPENRDPMNSIIVGFTGGMDSCLALYLIGACNTQQVIPYNIHPVCVTSTLCDQSKGTIEENWDNVKLMCRLIQDKVGGNIKNLQFISAPPDSPRITQPADGLFRYFSATSDEFDSFRFRKHKYIYTGANALPSDPEFPKDLLIVRCGNNPPPPWNVFMMNLEKYHIVDALLQLGLEDVIEKTAKCSRNHTSLLEKCVSFACQERRWAFTKINREDIGSKYFLTRNLDMTQQNQKIENLLPVGKLKVIPQNVGTNIPLGPPAVSPPPTVGGPG